MYFTLYLRHRVHSDQWIWFLFNNVKSGQTEENRGLRRDQLGDTRFNWLLTTHLGDIRGLDHCQFDWYWIGGAARIRHTQRYQY